jgi:hypothetical protein
VKHLADASIAKGCKEEKGWIGQGNPDNLSWLYGRLQQPTRLKIKAA